MSSFISDHGKKDNLSGSTFFSTLKSISAGRGRRDEKEVKDRKEYWVMSFLVLSPNIVILG